MWLPPSTTSSKFADLVGDVVDRRLVGAVAEQQRVLVLVVLGLHERAHVEQLIGDAEAQPLGVEGDGLLPAVESG